MNVKVAVFKSRQALYLPGWRSVLQSLAVAAADSKASVVQVSLSACEEVVAALYRGVGVDTEAFPEVCYILETAMRNPHHQEHSATAARLIPAVAEKLGPVR